MKRSLVVFFATCGVVQGWSSPSIINRVEGASLKSRSGNRIITTPISALPPRHNNHRLSSQQLYVQANPLNGDLLSEEDPSLKESSATTRTAAKVGMDDVSVVEESPRLVVAATEENDMFSAEQMELITKALNALLLICCFGFAINAIVNVNNGMTRGWSQTEIAMRIPLDNWASYESALAESPVQTKTMINVIIYLLGDWLSQTLFQGKNVLDFDATRTFRNGFIGLCFGPLVHLYYEWSDSILPVDAGLMNRLEKIFMDQTLYLTVKCTIYIMAVGLLAGESFEAVQKNVKDKIVPICFTAWKFWPLIHCITYSLIPSRHRILWVNSVDLVWNAILASKAAEDTTGEGEDASGTPAAIESVEATAVVVEDKFVLKSSEMEEVSSSSPPRERLVVHTDSFNTTSAFKEGAVCP
eukprot:CAMPEP_0194047588 /NCGR_PEP_ID=MMETSP0009_2-20130614/25056_1 /TAXON_ID=210454 /ORGANISM="Grammatophora oceanica, Strain CCMP 410" /LENGTH=413 /DNA_ID=CAMNT_0038693249 /DNA_START=249 /DNA_END=1490 /DNA_ORIENTATION=+